MTVFSGSQNLWSFSTPPTTTSSGASAFGIARFLSYRFSSFAPSGFTVIKGLLFPKNVQCMESMQPRDNGEDPNNYGPNKGKGEQRRFQMPIGPYPPEMRKGAKSEPYGKGAPKGGTQSGEAWLSQGVSLINNRVSIPVEQAPSASSAPDQTDTWHVDQDDHWHHPTQDPETNLMDSPQSNWSNVCEQAMITSYPRPGHPSRHYDPLNLLGPEPYPADTWKFALESVCVPRNGSLLTRYDVLEAMSKMVRSRPFASLAEGRAFCDITQVYKFRQTWEVPQHWSGAIWECKSKGTKWTPYEPWVQLELARITARRNNPMPGHATEPPILQYYFNHFEQKHWLINLEARTQYNPDTVSTREIRTVPVNEQVGRWYVIQTYRDAKHTSPATWSDIDTYFGEARVRTVINNHRDGYVDKRPFKEYLNLGVIPPMHQQVRQAHVVSPDPGSSNYNTHLANAFNIPYIETTSESAGAALPVRLQPVASTFEAQPATKGKAKGLSKGELIAADEAQRSAMYARVDATNELLRIAGEQLAANNTGVPAQILRQAAASFAAINAAQPTPPEEPISSGAAASGEASTGALLEVSASVANAIDTRDNQVQLGESAGAELPNVVPLAASVLSEIDLSCFCERDGQHYPIRTKIEGKLASEINIAVSLETIHDLAHRTDRVSVNEGEDESATWAHSTYDHVWEMRHASSVPGSHFKWPKQSQQYHLCISEAIAHLPPGACVAIQNDAPDPQWLRDECRDDADNVVPMYHGTDREGSLGILEYGFGCGPGAGTDALSALFKCDVVGTYFSESFATALTYPQSYKTSVYYKREGKRTKAGAPGGFFLDMGGSLPVRIVFRTLGLFNKRMWNRSISQLLIDPRHVHITHIMIIAYDAGMPAQIQLKYAAYYSVLTHRQFHTTLKHIRHWYSRSLSVESLRSCITGDFEDIEEHFYDTGCSIPGLEKIDQNLTILRMMVPRQCLAAIKNADSENRQKYAAIYELLDPPSGSNLSQEYPPLSWEPHYSKKVCESSYIQQAPRFHPVGILDNNEMISRINCPVNSPNAEWSLNFNPAMQAVLTMCPRSIIQVCINNKRGEQERIQAVKDANTRVYVSTAALLKNPGVSGDNRKLINLGTISELRTVDPQDTIDSNPSNDSSVTDEAPNKKRKNRHRKMDSDKSKAPSLALTKAFRAGIQSHLVLDGSCLTMNYNHKVYRGDCDVPSGNINIETRYAEPCVIRDKDYVHYIIRTPHTTYHAPEVEAAVNMNIHSAKELIMLAEEQLSKGSSFGSPAGAENPGIVNWYGDHVGNSITYTLLSTTTSLGAYKNQSKGGVIARQALDPSVPDSLGASMLARGIQKRWFANTKHSDQVKEVAQHLGLEYRDNKWFPLLDRITMMKKLPPLDMKFRDQITNMVMSEENLPLALHTCKWGGDQVKQFNNYNWRHAQDNVEAVRNALNKPISERFVPAEEPSSSLSGNLASVPTVVLKVGDEPISHFARSSSPEPPQRIVTETEKLIVARRWERRKKRIAEQVESTPTQKEWDLLYQPSPASEQVKWTWKSSKYVVPDPSDESAGAEPLQVSEITHYCALRPCKGWTQSRTEHGASIYTSDTLTDANGMPLIRYDWPGTPKEDLVHPNVSIAVIDESKERVYTPQEKGPAALSTSSMWRVQAEILGMASEPVQGQGGGKYQLAEPAIGAQLPSIAASSSIAAPNTAGSSADHLTPNQIANQNTYGDQWF